jgi:hypothetical protein
VGFGSNGSYFWHGKTYLREFREVLLSWDCSLLSGKFKNKNKLLNLLDGVEKSWEYEESSWKF